MIIMERTMQQGARYPEVSHGHIADVGRFWKLLHTDRLFALI